MKIAFFGDSLTEGIPGASYVKKVKQSLPQHQVLNYGKINDTPLSLYQRIRSQKLDQPVDVAFIFVGVNDLLIERSQVFSRIRQQWARTDDEFRQHYSVLLTAICGFARRVLCVSPLFIGEDFGGYWQQRLSERAEMIARLTDAQSSAEYLDLRSIFMRALQDKPVVSGVGQNFAQSVWDGLTGRSEARIAHLSAVRGFHYTIDGVHLNDTGAEVVAAQCLEALQNQNQGVETRRLLHDF